MVESMPDFEQRNEPNLREAVKDIGAAWIFGKYKKTEDELKAKAALELQGEELQEKYEDIHYETTIKARNEFLENPSARIEEILGDYRSRLQKILNYVDELRLKPRKDLKSLPQELEQLEGMEFEEQRGDIPEIKRGRAILFNSYDQLDVSQKIEVLPGLIERLKEKIDTLEKFIAQEK